MKYCDYCGKIIAGAKNLKNAIIGLDLEIYYHLCKPLESLNPHKFFLRRWFWTPDYPLHPRYQIDFCNKKCFQEWKLIIKEKVEEMVSKNAHKEP